MWVLLISIISSRFEIKLISCSLLNYFLLVCYLHQGWKCFYIKWHREMAQRAASVAQHIEQCSSGASLEIRDYLKAIEELNSMQLGFGDIQMFFFRPRVSVLLNLVGLHYSISWLSMPVSNSLFIAPILPCRC